MFTNILNHGGNFRDVIDDEFNSATSITIASGYASLDVIHAYKNRFLKLAESGGVSFKNIRSKKSLQIFGIWLKGKLEKNGVLNKYELVTAETLEEYGNDKLIFYKIGEKEYFMKF